MSIWSFGFDALTRLTMLSHKNTKWTQISHSEYRAKLISMVKLKSPPKTQETSYIIDSKEYNLTLIDVLNTNYISILMIKNAELVRRILSFYAS